jgi:uncharacterized HAD superfamily protein
MKTRIAVDIDNVIFIHHDMTIDRINEEFELNLNRWDVDEYNYVESYAKAYPDINKKKMQKFLDEIMTDPEYLYQAAPSLPMLSALRALAGLSADGTGVLILTSRPESIKSETRLMLDKHGIAYSKVIHTKDKAMACRSNNIRYLIEDNPEHAEAVKMVGVSVFLIDYPYNQGVKATGDNGVWRVINPINIPDLIRKDLGLS